MQMNSFMIYMLSCWTSSGINCGHLCVVLLSFSWDVCLCNSWHIDVINMPLLFHYSYHSLRYETAVQFCEITCDGSMNTHIRVFDLVPSETLLLRLHLHILHDMVQVDFHHLFVVVLCHKIYIYIALHV